MDKTELVLIAEGNEDYFKDVITLKYRKYEEQRGRQIADINELREQIYEKAERSGDWKSWVKLPEIYELSQTLQAHLTESLYSNPAACIGEVCYPGRGIGLSGLHPALLPLHSYVRGHKE